MYTYFVSYQEGHEYGKWYSNDIIELDHPILTSRDLDEVKDKVKRNEKNNRVTILNLVLLDPLPHNINP